VPLVSLNHFLNQACENGWQGKPAQSTSKLGSSFSFILVISQAKFQLTNKSGDNHL